MENKNDEVLNANVVEVISADGNEVLDEKKIENKKQSKIVRATMIIIPLFIAIFSIAIVSKYASSTKIHSDTIHSLQEKQNTVLKISATSATIAASASLLLGDRANAVSSKLLDLTGYFVIILCAIMLEKYLVTVMGMVSFQVLIPAACIMFSIFTIYNRDAYRKLAVRIVIFALGMFAIIPFSVNISSLIENTYNEANMQVMISEGEDLKKEIDSEIGNIKDSTDNMQKSSEIVREIESTTANGEQENNEGFMNALANIGKGIADTVVGAKDKVVETVSGVVAVATEKANELINKLTSQLNKMIETIAVMLVTTCVIPVCVILFFFWLVKMLFNVEINVDAKKLPRLSKVVKRSKE